MSLDLYILDGHEPVRFDDGFVAWSLWMANSNNRIVAQDSIGDAQISTVFLGLDQGFGRMPKPILFETIIFGGAHDYQTRCATWDDALAMHAVALAHVQAWQ